MSAVELTTFDFLGRDLRAFEDENGVAWFIAADIATVLEYRSTSNATRLLDEDMKGAQIVSTPGGDQRMNVITQGGLWRLIMRSQREEARRLERKVVDEILPTIHRTGRYSLPGTEVAIPAQRQPEAQLDIPRSLPAALRAYANEVEAHGATRAEKEVAEAKVAEMTPAALAWSRMVEPVDGWDVKGAAQAISSVGVAIGEGRLFALLLSERWAYRDGSKRLRPMQSQIDNGRLKTKLQTRPLRDEGGSIVGTQSAVPQIRLTKKGIERIIAIVATEKMKEIGA